MKRKCFMPNCPNTDENSSKVFIRVPQNVEIRKRWWQEAGYTLKKLHIKSSLYCCQDHFKIPEDFQNWGYAKYLGTRFLVKKGVLPRPDDVIRREKESETSNFLSTEEKVAGEVEIKTENLDEPEYWVPEDISSSSENYETTENNKCDIELSETVPKEQDLDVKHDINYYQQFLNNDNSWDRNFTEVSGAIHRDERNSVKQEGDSENDSTSTRVKTENAVEWKESNEYDSVQSDDAKTDFEIGEVFFTEEKVKFSDEDTTNFEEETKCSDNELIDVCAVEECRDDKGERLTSQTGQIEECNKGTSDQSNITENIRITEKSVKSAVINRIYKVKEYHCKFCNYSSKRNSVTQHIEAVHLKLKRHKCDFCGNSFASKTQLKTHRDSVHLKITRYACEYCKFKFYNKDGLMKHIKLHFKAKKYNCEYCEYGTNRFVALKKHQSTIHKDKTFKCKDCEYATEFEGQLEWHKYSVHLK